MVVQHPISERQKRQAVMQQFELQLPRFPALELLERFTNYRYRLHDHARGVDVLATVLSTSFDFYAYRLNLHKQKVGMVICQHHNAALPLWVLELDTAMLYHPAAVRDDLTRPREQRKKRTQEEVRVFVSQLVIGIDSAYDELQSMPERTRQRYLAMRTEYLRPRIGRPWAS